MDTENIPHEELINLILLILYTFLKYTFSILSAKTEQQQQIIRKLISSSVVA